MFLSFDLKSKEIKIISIKNKYKIINNIKSYGLNANKKNIYLLNFENNQIVKINKDLKKITLYSSNNENIYEDKFDNKIFKRKYKNQIINKPHSIEFLDEKIFLINLGDQKQNGNITVLNNKLKKIKTIKKYFPVIIVEQNKGNTDAVELLQSWGYKLKGIDDMFKSDYLMVKE